VQSVLRDYASGAVSLERAELDGMVDEVRSGRRLGLVAMDSNRNPIGVMLYRRTSGGEIAVDFAHVIREHQSTGAERAFVRSFHHRVAAMRPSEVTVESFVTGTAEGLVRSLARLGYESYPRYLMARALSVTSGSDTGGTDYGGRLPELFRLLPWGTAKEDDVARLIFNAHAGRREPRMGGDSLEGALAQVAGLARSGVFSAEISTLAMDGPAPVGVVMTTRPTQEDLMIVEVAVAPARQGLGIGKATMSRTLREAALARAQRVWLVVNAANRPAIALYRSTGFSVSRPVINCRWRPTVVATDSS
jgi:ribosomal protein S18 acetylase RimI-like enzyme/predicted GNAT family acetyltransferase